MNGYGRFPWVGIDRFFHQEDKNGAEYALEQIGKLYKVEQMADDQDLDFEQRSELRKRLAYPIMRAFEKWIVAYHPKALPGGRMSKALSYTYNLFERLSRYHLDGRYLPDNNLAENAIRPQFRFIRPVATHLEKVQQMPGISKRFRLIPRDSTTT